MAGTIYRQRKEYGGKGLPSSPEGSAGHYLLKEGRKKGMSLCQKFVMSPLPGSSGSGATPI